MSWAAPQGSSAARAAGRGASSLWSGDFEPGPYTVRQELPAGWTADNNADADGVKDASEAGVSGWRVFIDDDKDGNLDTWETSVTTDSTGLYRFANVAAGDHRITIADRSGWRPTDPASGYYDLNQTGDMVTSS